MESAWKKLLNADSVQWLLEEENPSVRYYTLKDILDKSEDDAQVKEAKRKIMEVGIVPRILEIQSTVEYRENDPRFYTSKYKGLVWQLIVLAGMGAEPNPQIKDQCEYLLNHSFEPEAGGFSMHSSAKKGGGRKTEVIPCLTGNMVWSLIRFGYDNDPRLIKAVEWLTRHMLFNDGVEEERQIAPYNRYEICWGKHTCLMGVVKALKGLSAIPEKQRSIEVVDTIERAVEFLLMHHLYKRSHDLSRKSKPGWLKLSYPLMYQTDLLEILEILTGLGVADERMEEAYNILLSKQDEMGRWKIEYTANTDRLLVPMEMKGEQSKWITLRALKVIKNVTALKMLKSV